MWIRVYLITLFSLLPCFSWAQDLSGHVVDEEGHPLIGVNVFVKETKKGTVTDTNGDYLIKNLSVGKYTIHFSFVGYHAIKKEIVLGKEELHLDITLRPLQNILSEVSVLDKRIEQRKKHASVVIETVDNDFIQENVGNSLMQTLEKLPGVNSMDIGAGFSKPVLRGLSFNRVAVVENGIGQAGQEWGADHGLEIDQMNVEQVEIIKGPASLLYGSDAIGGVIVIQPPKAPKNYEIESQFAGTYKSNNNLFGTSAYTGFRNDKFFLRARFTGNWFGDYKVPAEEFYYNTWWLPIYDGKLKNTAGKEVNGSFVAGWVDKWGRTSISVSNVHQEMGFFPGSHGIPNKESLKRDGNSRDYDLPLQQVDHLKILSNTQLFDGNKSWYLDLAYQKNDRKEFSSPHTHGYEAMPENDLELEFILQTFSGKLRQSITGIHEQLKFEYGVTGEHRNNKIGGYSFLIPSYKRSSVGVFTYLNVHLSESLTINGGMRYDFGTYAIDQYEDPYVKNLFPSDSDRQEFYRYRSKQMNKEYHDFSFGTGLSWLFTEKWNLKFNIGKSFRMPNVNELSANGIHHGSFRFEKGDEDLKSEVAYQGDIVLLFNHNKFNFSLSPYVNYFTNYIYLQPSGSFSDLPHAGQVHQFMQNPALRWGGEFAVDWNPYKILEFNLNAEYIYAYNLETQYALPMTPPANATLGASYKFSHLTKFFSDFKLGLEFKLVADQQETTVNELPTDGYQLLNARLSTKINLGKQKARLALQVRNLLDTKYLNHVSYYRMIEIPEPGRNVVVNLTIPMSFSLKN